MKYLIQTRQEGPKTIATVSKEMQDQRDGAYWEIQNVVLADTEQDAIRAVLREWTGGQV